MEHKTTSVLQTEALPAKPQVVSETIRASVGTEDLPLRAQSEKTTQPFTATVRNLARSIGPSSAIDDVITKFLLSKQIFEEMECDVNPEAYQEMTLSKITFTMTRSGKIGDLSGILKAVRQPNRHYPEITPDMAAASATEGQQISIGAQHMSIDFDMALGKEKWIQLHTGRPWNNMGSVALIIAEAPELRLDFLINISVAGALRTRFPIDKRDYLPLNVVSEVVDFSNATYDPVVGMVYTVEVSWPLDGVAVGQVGVVRWKSSFTLRMKATDGTKSELFAVNLGYHHFRCEVADIVTISLQDLPNLRYVNNVTKIDFESVGIQKAPPTYTSLSPSSDGRYATNSTVDDYCEMMRGLGRRPTPGVLEVMASRKPTSPNHAVAIEGLAARIYLLEKRAFRTGQPWYAKLAQENAVAHMKFAKQAAEKLLTDTTLVRKSACSVTEKREIDGSTVEVHLETGEAGREILSAVSLSVSFTNSTTPAQHADYLSQLGYDVTLTLVGEIFAHFQ